MSVTHPPCFLGFSTWVNLQIKIFLGNLSSAVNIRQFSSFLYHFSSRCFQAKKNGRWLYDAVQFQAEDSVQFGRVSTIGIFKQPSQLERNRNLLVEEQREFPPSGLMLAAAVPRVQSILVTGAEIACYERQCRSDRMTACIAFGPDFLNQDIRLFVLSFLAPTPEYAEGNWPCKLSTMYASVTKRRNFQLEADKSALLELSSKCRPEENGK